MKKSTIFTIGLLISFFLPWYTVTIFTVSGYDLPTTLNKLDNLRSLFKKDSDYDIDTFLNKITYILYAIPIFSILRIIENYSNEKKLPSFLSKFHFIVGFFFTPILIVKGGITNSTLTPEKEIGFYLTFLFSILGLLITDDVWSQEKTISSPKKSEKNTSSFDENSNLLNQLSQIHGLKEKNLIDDDIYERQKSEILKKLEEIKASLDPSDNETLETEENDNSYIKKEETSKLIRSNRFNKKVSAKTMKIILFSLLLIIISISIYKFYLNSTTKNSKKLSDWLTSTIKKEIMISPDSLAKADISLENFDNPAGLNSTWYEKYLKVDDREPKLTVQPKLITLDFSGEDDTMNFFLTEKCLIRSYHLSAGSNGGTSIYWLKRKANEDYSFTIFKIENNIAQISRDGYSNGHYWQKGTLNLDTEEVIWGEIER